MTTDHDATPRPGDAAGVPQAAHHPAMPDTRQHVLAGADGTLAYDEAGDHGSPPLVLLHGLSANSTSWAPVIARSGQDRRIFAIDFRGHGRSGRTPGRYRLDDYVDDAARLLRHIDEPAVVVGHSLGAVVAAELAQDRHPLVAAVFLEDPPIYVVEPEVFDTTSLARGFRVLREHVARLQAEQAPTEVYRDLLAASPHPAGDRLGDHLHDDALWSRAAALAETDLDAIDAVLDGTTFAAYDPDRPIPCPGLVVRADPAYDAAFEPAHEERLWRDSPHVRVIPMPGAGHNVRGDRASRTRYLDALTEFLDHQLDTAVGG
jgi:pimeloyl-ACP methyl ester carboxylesterase